MTWIQTRNRIRFDLLHPRTEQVCIEDVAWSLSHLCRFGGHTDRFYSVAQHSVLCSRVCDDPELAYAALLHDAHEAYVGDMVKPLKAALGDVWTELETCVARTVALAFGLDWPLPGKVHEIDLALLHGEAIERLHSPIDHWTRGLPEPARARELFLERYTLLSPICEQLRVQRNGFAYRPDTCPRHLAGAAVPLLSARSPRTEDEGESRRAGEGECQPQETMPQETRS